MPAGYFGVLEAGTSKGLPLQHPEFLSLLKELAPGPGTQAGKKQGQEQSGNMPAALLPFLQTYFFHRNEFL